MIRPVQKGDRVVITNTFLTQGWMGTVVAHRLAGGNSFWLVVLDKDWASEPTEFSAGDFQVVVP